MAQAVDFTTLCGICHELKPICIPSRVEQIVQLDNYGLYLILRSYTGKNCLYLGWHPQTARLHLTGAPPNHPSSFVFGQQVAQKIKGLALIQIDFLSPWERVIILGFAQRPQAPIDWQLNLEIMGKYSNALLINGEGIVISLAHQVSDKQSRLRPIGTGDRYVPPPQMFTAAPSLGESFDEWHDRLCLIPNQIKKSLVQIYQGVSPSLANNLLRNSGIEIDKLNSQLTRAEWLSLHSHWQKWLQAIELGHWQISTEEDGYSLLPTLDNNKDQNPNVINTFLDRYYAQQDQHQEFRQLYQRIKQVISSRIAKLNSKIQEFQQKLLEGDRADNYRHQADLLSAYAHLWRAGMHHIALPNFDDNQIISIPLDPLLNPFQNAEVLYRKHQKQKRARIAILPLLEEATQEVNYLETILIALNTLENDDSKSLDILKEIEQELLNEGYLSHPRHKPNKSKNAPQNLNCHRFVTPSNFAVWVGRNNLQNDILSFQIAGNYDLWFHSQEIAGSHVLLRLQAGDAPSDLDLQTCADLAAYFSKARLSDRVPVVYTQPKFLRRPKGGKLGMVIYQNEKIWWGCPQTIANKIKTS